MSKLPIPWFLLAACVVTQIAATFPDCPADCPVKRKLTFKRHAPLEVDIDPFDGTDPNVVFKGSNVILQSEDEVSVSTHRDVQYIVLAFWVFAQNAEDVSATILSVNTVRPLLSIEKKEDVYSWKLPKGAEPRKINSFGLFLTPQASSVMRYGNLKMVVCLPDVPEVGDAVCPPSCPSKKLVTYDDNHGFQFEVVSGAAASDALKGSGKKMSSRLAQTLRVTFQNDMDFLLLAFELKVIKAASVTGRSDPSGISTELSAIRKKNKTNYSWRIRRISRSNHIRFLELALTPATEQLMHYKNFLLVVCIP